MTFFDRLERRWGWLAFPNFLRYYALFHVLVFVLQLIRPDIGQVLEFDRAKIFSGEIWRIATLFFADSEFGNPRSATSIVLLYFAVNFAFMVSDGLETLWGTFKSSLFYYTGIALVIIANFAYSAVIPGMSTLPFSGTVLYASAILAFATLLPKVEIRLAFILPVQMRFIGILTALGIFFLIIKMPLLLPFYIVALVNYFVWAGIPALRGTVRVLESGKRNKRFNSGKIPASEAFHACAVCGKTDVTDPLLEFRVGSDDREFCADHLPE